MKNKYSTLTNLLILVSCFVFLLQSNTAHALDFFSINTETDELVRINSSTGVVTVVGSLGYNIPWGVDLVNFNGKLYGFESNHGVETNLLEIDPVSGAVISLQQATLNNVSPQLAEGFANYNGKLLIGYNTINASSEYIGELSLTGEITNSFSPSSFTDIDALCADSNLLYNFDVHSPYNYTKFNTIDPLTGTVTNITTYANATFAPNDCDIVDNSLYGINTYSNQIQRIGIADGTYESFPPFNVAGVYRGLVVVEEVANLSIENLSGTDTTINPLPLAGQAADISATFTTNTNSPVQWQLSVDGRLIEEGSGPRVQAAWDGRNGEGKIEPGTYDVVLTATTDDNTMTATQTMKGEVDWNDNCELDIRFSAPCESPSTNGLVAFLPFNGNADDVSGNGNNGIVYGATLTEDRFGNPGSAYSFDGYDDRIGIPNNAPLQPPNLSIALWFYSDPLYGNPNSYLDSEHIFSNNRYLGPSTDHGYFLSLNHIDSKIVFTLNNNTKYLNTATDMQDRVWNFVAATYDGTQMKLYLNGVLIDSQLYTGGYTPSNMQELTIGCLSHSYTTYQHHYSGKIDDVRFYNRALTEEEILLLYSPGCQF